MGDGKALQMGTSHELGQNFARVFDTQFLTETGERRDSLADALRAFIAARLGTPLPADVWDGREMPAHLLMNLRVVDESGRELAMGRDLNALRAHRDRMLVELATRLSVRLNQ